MHELMVEQVIARCRQRSREGDCPTVDAFGTETLEDAVVQLAADRDAANTRSLENLANAMKIVMPDLAVQIRDRWNSKMAAADAALNSFLQTIRE